MKDSKVYASSALSVERLADDGWPEDAGWWPLFGPASLSAAYCHQAAGRRFPSQVIQSFVRRSIERKSRPWASTQG